MQAAYFALDRYQDAHDAFARAIDDLAVAAMVAADAIGALRLAAGDDATLLAKATELDFARQKIAAMGDLDS